VRRVPPEAYLSDTRAKQMNDPEAKSTVLKNADDYERSPYHAPGIRLVVGAIENVLGAIMPS
jgi:hypothetical protein